MNRRKEYAARALRHYEENTENEIAAYAETVIRLPESRRWDYAIPENYTNYADGFLWQDCDPYRGQPMLNYNGEILYLHRRFEYCDRADGEAEKYLLFDRHGHKYTFVTMKEEDHPGGNPSYFEFLPRVKKYAPTRAALIRKRLEEIKNQKGGPA